MCVSSPHASPASCPCALPVDRAVLEAQGHHAAALPVLHQQVQGKVLDEVVTVVLKGLAVQGVQEGVASTVGHTAASEGEKGRGKVVGRQGEMEVCVCVCVLIYICKGVCFFVWTAVNMYI